MRVNTSFTIFTILFFYSLELLGAYPTAEGLFRNSNNQEVNAVRIVVKFLIKEMNESSGKVQETEPAKEDEFSLTETSKSKVSDVYVKYLISLENEFNTEVFQMAYDNGKMKYDSLRSINYIKNLKRKILQDKNFSRSFFYSLMDMFVMNSSEKITEILKRVESGFASNKSLINWDKRKLLQQYKQYLQAIKNDKELQKTLESPLKPIEEEKVVKVKEVMSTNYLKKSKDVKLFREDKEFYWKIDYPNLKAKFTNELHQLKDLEVNWLGNGYKYIFSNYILFNGIHTLPKFIIFKDEFGRMYKVQILELRHYGKTTNNFKKDISKIKETFETMRLNSKQLEVFPPKNLAFYFY